MRCVRFLLPPVVIVAVLVLTGALGQQASRPPQTPPKAPAQKAPPPKEDAAAAQILKDAVRTLAALEWVETSFWQQADMQGLTFQAEGHYQAEPKTRRLHLDLTVHVGNTTGRLEVVSDGAVVWEKLQAAKGAKPDIRKTELKKVLEGLKSANQEQVQTALLQTQSLAGVAPLLQNIQEQMTVTQQEKATWRGREVTKLTAAWSERVAKGLTPPGGSWERGLPRKCVLYLDRPNGPVPYWPYRIEWWGPAATPKEDVVLLQMEFRDPQRTRSLTDEQYRNVFTFHPGTATAVDLTRENTERVKGRVNQLAAQKNR